MSLPELLNLSWTAAVVNHLWQSTMVAAIAWLLTLALRKNHARTRYWVWLIASMKFLVPFSLLMAAGEWLRSLIAAPMVARPAVTSVVEQLAQPYPDLPSFVPTGHSIVEHGWKILPALLVANWAIGTLIVACSWMVKWLRIRAVARQARPLELVADVPVLATRSLLEPGVFGILRPVLLLPEGILERLAPEQFHAILAHEMGHVRRRDNLTFALHMVVQTLFWMHPLVWWIGARLVEERERACDEGVLETGSAAEDYAESILHVCRFYVESPAVCTAGVTGADLKKRIVRIMTEGIAKNLDLSRKLLLGFAALIAVTAPLVLGLMHAAGVSAESKAEEQAANLPKFDVASIKPHKDEGMMMRLGMQLTPDGINATGMPVRMLMRQAFGVSDDRILNEPDWVKSNRYDIEAKVAPEDVPKLKGLTGQQRGVMMLPLLEDRFGLKFHHETRVMNVYTLVVAKGGLKLKAAQPQQAGAVAPFAMKPGAGGADMPPPPPSPGAGGGQGAVKSGAPGPGGAMPRLMMRMSSQGMTMEGRGSTMAMLADVLSQQLSATVVDKTGLAGSYDYTLSWMPDMSMGSGPMMMKIPGGPPAEGGGQETAPADSGPSLFTAVQEQLGLKLVAQKEPVDVIVIDHIEQPSEN